MHRDLHRGHSQPIAISARLALCAATWLGHAGCADAAPTPVATARDVRVRTAGGGHGQSAPPGVDALRERVLAQAALSPGMRVAEIGLGRGWFVFRAAEAVGPDGVVYATDIDSEATDAMRRQLPNINPAAGHVDVRVCRNERDTALDDLPEGHLDVIFMVDSLCFDASEPRERDVSYLRRLARVLRPGGSLIHHMDCTCAASLASVGAIFSEAGFSPNVERVEVATATAGTEDHCPTETERARQRLVAVFRTPAAPSGPLPP